MKAVIFMDTIDLNKLNCKIIALRINDTYSRFIMGKYEKNEFKIYECARTCWDLDLRKARKADYIVAVVNGEIKGVYTQEAWIYGHATENTVIKKHKICKHRHEFVGKILRNDLAKRLIGKQIVGYDNSNGKPYKYYGY